MKIETKKNEQTFTNEQLEYLYQNYGTYFSYLVNNYKVALLKKKNVGKDVSIETYIVVYSNEIDEKSGFYINGKIYGAQYDLRGAFEKLINCVVELSDAKEEVNQGLRFF